LFYYLFSNHSQEEKIDALIKINQELEQRLGELRLNTNSDGKHANETVKNLP